MICGVCDQPITSDELPLKVFGELIHPTCDIVDVKGKACPVCWVIHAPAQSECW